MGVSGVFSIFFGEALRGFRNFTMFFGAGFETSGESPRFSGTSVGVSGECWGFSETFSDFPEKPGVSPELLGSARPHFRHFGAFMFGKMWFPTPQFGQFWVIWSGSPGRSPRAGVAARA